MNSKLHAGSKRKSDPEVGLEATPDRTGPSTAGVAAAGQQSTEVRSQQAIANSSSEQAGGELANEVFQKPAPASEVFVPVPVASDSNQQPVPTLEDVVPVPIAFESNQQPVPTSENFVPAPDAGGDQQKAGGLLSKMRRMISRLGGTERAPRASHTSDRLSVLVCERGNRSVGLVFQSRAFPN